MNILSVATRIATATSFGIAAPAIAQGPVIVPTEIGVLYRYRGDTIWNERDSTVRRTVFRGDTVETVTTRGGRPYYSRIVVISGDSARPIANLDSLGKAAPPGGAFPARMAMSDREMLAMQIRSADMRARAAARGSATTVPLSPANPVTYCIDGALNIIQHRDTARYVRARGGGRFDTTTYVFTGDTTVRRISPDERAFGYTMYNTIVGEMHMSLVRKSLASRNTGQTIALPGKDLVECKS